MGWSGASELLRNVSVAFEKAAPCAVKAKKVAFYVATIKALEQHDADSLGECEGMNAALDAALKKTGNLYEDM